MVAKYSRIDKTAQIELFRSEMRHPDRSHCSVLTFAVLGDGKNEFARKSTNKENTLNHFRVFPDCGEVLLS